MPNDNNFTPANFDPILQKYDGVPYLRFWCQKVLPAVYDQSLSYYEVLCKLAAFLNKTVDEMEKIENNTVCLKALKNCKLTLMTFLAIMMSTAQSITSLMKCTQTGNLQR